jgi:hypothetical protein
MLLLDTNVISELMKSQPEPRVLDWFDRCAALPLFTSAVSEAELWAGVALLPEGKRRQNLSRAVAAMLVEDFAGRSLVFDSAAARRYSDIFAARRGAGRPITQADCQIAAIAVANNLKLVTRNSSDFDNCGIDVINPWSG